jgi:serine/threonine protein kinase
MTPDQPLIAGKYRVLRSLAEGGMGALFLAEHVELETVVVVKRLLELRGSDADVARFKREAKAAAALRSRHIVRVHDFGTDEAGPYLVMEQLRGQDLCSLIEQRGALPVAEAVEIFRQATKGMRVAHQAGVVHRDIKPSNLFLAEEEGEIVVKVLDFGIAKRFAVREGSAAITASGMLLGSPGYMAPEQVRGQRVDTRADVWALGVVLYEMLTNAPPFYSEHVGDMLVRVCAGDYALASSLNPALGRGWDAFFALALEIDADQRFPNVEVMLYALDLVLGGSTDLDRVLVGAPTLKATSGAVGSLAPPALNRDSASGGPRSRSSAGAKAQHSPRTLDASQVPISEPTPTRTTSSRRLLWAAAVGLTLGGAAWVWLDRSNRPIIPEVALEAAPPGPNVRTTSAPASAEAAAETLPTAELPMPERTPAAADTAPKPIKARPAAPAKTSTTKPVSQPTTTSPTTKPKSKEPKRDPFTGLVTE